MGTKITDIKTTVLFASFAIEVGDVACKIVGRCMLIVEELIDEKVIGNFFDEFLRAVLLLAMQSPPAMVKMQHLRQKENIMSTFTIKNYSELFI